MNSPARLRALHSAENRVGFWRVLQLDVSLGSTNRIQTARFAKAALRSVRKAPAAVSRTLRLRSLFLELRRMLLLVAIRFGRLGRSADSDGLVLAEIESWGCLYNAGRWMRNRLIRPQPRSLLLNPGKLGGWRSSRTGHRWRRNGT